MTGLVRLLAAILGAHIQRDDLPATDTHDRAAVGIDYGFPFAAAVHMPVAPVRPCWACGDPVGFHVEHLPCWKLPAHTWKTEPTMRTFADGGLL